MDRTLITNVNVLDCTGSPPFYGEILVDGQRIKQVATSADTIPRDNVAVVDGRGGYLMPGLIESHAHLCHFSNHEAADRRHGFCCYLAAALDSAFEDQASHVCRLEAQSSRLL